MRPYLLMVLSIAMSWPVNNGWAADPSPAVLLVGTWRVQGAHQRVETTWGLAADGTAIITSGGDTTKTAYKLKQDMLMMKGPASYKIVKITADVVRLQAADGSDLTLTRIKDASTGPSSQPAASTGQQSVGRVELAGEKSIRMTAPAKGWPKSERASVRISILKARPTGQKAHQMLLWEAKLGEVETAAGMARGLARKMNMPCKLTYEDLDVITIAGPKKEECVVVCGTIRHKPGDADSETIGSALAYFYLDDWKDGDGNLVLKVPPARWIDKGEIKVFLCDENEKVLATRLLRADEAVKSPAASQPGAGRIDPASNRELPSIVGQWRVETQGQIGEKPVWTFTPDGKFTSTVAGMKGTYEFAHNALVLRSGTENFGFAVEVANPNLLILRVALNPKDVTTLTRIGGATTQADSSGKPSLPATTVNITIVNTLATSVSFSAGEFSNKHTLKAGERMTLRLKPEKECVVRLVSGQKIDDTGYDALVVRPVAEGQVWRITEQRVGAKTVPTIEEQRGTQEQNGGRVLRQRSGRRG